MGMHIRDATTFKVVRNFRATTFKVVRRQRMIFADCVLTPVHTVTGERRALAPFRYFAVLWVRLLRNFDPGLCV